MFNWVLATEEAPPKCNTFTGKWTVKEKEATASMHFICMLSSGGIFRMFPFVSAWASESCLGVLFRFKSCASECAGCVQPSVEAIVSFASAGNCATVEKVCSLEKKLFKEPPIVVGLLQFRGQRASEHCLGCFAHGSPLPPSMQI